MRKWHAIPVAVLVAVATAAGLFSAVAPAEAGTSPYTLSVDCDTALAGIQSACTFPTGTTTVDVDIVFSNVSGANPTEFNAFDFELIATQQTLFNPPTVAGTTDANPDANDAILIPGGAWACSPPAPSADQDPNPAVAQSFLSCFSAEPVGGTFPTVATGASAVVATVTYNVSGDVTSALSFGAASTGDPQGIPLVTCGVEDCNGATVTVGAGGSVDTPTPAAPTNTPCATCPTPTGTSEAFVTITPTPGGETATPVPPGGDTPVPPPPGGGEPPPGGQAPGGGAGAGGGAPIRLPDTGNEGNGAIDWSSMSLVAMLALAAGAVAGGTYYYAARRVTARGRDE